MQSGRLRFRFALEAPIADRDAIGGVTVTWQTQATVWGDLVPLRGREWFEAKQIESRLTHRLTLRYTAALDPSWRLREVASGRVFHPESVIDVDTRHRMLTVQAIEVVEPVSL